MTRGVSPQASAVVRPTASSRCPDLGDVLDADPVQLDVLPVGDVGGVAGELGADLGDGAQLVAARRAAVAADPEHEVLVVELAGVEGGGLAAVDAGLALGVEPPPAHPAAQVLAGDRGEPLLGVDLLDALPDVEAVVGLLELLVGVQRGAVAVGPGAGGLACLPLRPGRGLASPSHCANCVMDCITVHYSTAIPTNSLWVCRAPAAPQRSSPPERPRYPEVGLRPAQASADEVEVVRPQWSSTPSGSSRMRSGSSASTAPSSWVTRTTAPL